MAVQFPIFGLLLSGGQRKDDGGGAGSLTAPPLIVEAIPQGKVVLKYKRIYVNLLLENMEISGN